jgi:hypothetical protein
MFEATDICDELNCPTSGPNIDWPDTLTITAEAGCSDVVDLGEACAPPPPPTSCCGVDVASHSVIYLATIESDCPALDGMVKELRWSGAGSVWTATYSFVPPRPDLIGGVCGPDPCFFPMTFSCGENDGIGTWALACSISCTAGGAGFCDLDDGGPSHTAEGPISGTCEPLNLVFERTLISHGDGCGTCNCYILITITIKP